jgi:hypothetical protein
MGKKYKCLTHNYLLYHAGVIYDASVVQHLVDMAPHRWEEIVEGCPTSRISTFADEVYTEVNRIAEMLIEKNRKYGNSALAPVRVFSKCDSVEQLKVRIDDKLSRLVSAQGDEDEDVADDLLGYLILLKLAKNNNNCNNYNS